MPERFDEECSCGGWEKLDDNNWEGYNGVFQIYTTSQFYRVDCCGMESDDKNQFIDIGSEFDCPLDDP